MKEENSGLIDLRALMAEAEREEKAQSNENLQVSQHIGVYPFGSPALTPLEAVKPATAVPSPSEAAVSTSPSSSSRRFGRRAGRPWAIAAGIFVAAGAMAAAAIHSDSLPLGPSGPGVSALGEGSIQRVPVPIRAGVSALTAAQAAPKPAAPEPQADDGSTSDRAAHLGAHVPRAPVINRTPAEEKPAAEAPSAVTKPTEADPCHGDLMCAMQRATKKDKK